MKKKESKKMTEESGIEQEIVTVSSKAELKSFLSSVRDRLLSRAAPPIYAMTAMNHVMSMEGLYDLLDKEAKEILQEIWVQLAQAGIQLRKPPMLFADPEIAAR